MNLITEIKTRLWLKDFHSTPWVQFVDNGKNEIKVFMLTNIGWVPIGNSNEIGNPEKYAEELATTYGLEEASQDIAHRYIE